MSASHNHTASRTRQIARLAVACLTLLLPFGCIRNDVSRLRPTPPEKTLIVALKSTDPNERYQSLVKLGQSKALSQDWSVRALIVIAQTDPSPLVRTLVAQHLGQIADQRVAEAILSLMADADARVRAQAARSLSQMPYAALEQAGLVEQSKSLLLTTLTQDANVDVRIHSAVALGNFKDKKDTQVLYGLISALRDVDFSVRYYAEQSLIKLTGQTFHTHAADWLEWLKNTKDPFQNAGQPPPQLAQPKQNVLQKTKEHVHQ